MLRIGEIEARLAHAYTGRRPRTRGIVWRWRWCRWGIAPGAFVPFSIRHGRRIGRLLWLAGFDYETCARWS